MAYEVVERVVPARPTAVVAETTTWSEYPELWRRLLDEVWGAVRADESVRPGRNVMLYKYDMPAVEVGVEVEVPFRGIGRVVASTLPAGRVVMTTHRGSWEVWPAHESVIAACEQRGLERLGPRWEIYGHWNEPGDEEVEVYCLVR
jgi:effector-binding domain-containing protein